MAVIRGPVFVPRFGVGVSPVGSNGVHLSGVLANAAGTPVGLTLSRMTTAQRDSMAAVNGMLIYNTTAGQCQRFRTGGGGWANF